MSCKVIMVTSFKGGVGKSTVAANIALRLACNGKKTLLVDCDFRMRSLDILLGVENNIVYDAGDVLTGDCTLSRAVMTDKRNSNLFFLPAPYNWQKGIDGNKFAEMIDEAKKIFFLDYIVLDTPGSSGQEFGVAAENADIAYIVANHSFPSIRAAEVTGSELADMGVEERRLVINMFDMSGKDSDKKPSVVDIIDKTYLRLGGIIPFDSRMSLLQDSGLLVDELKNCNIAKAFTNLVNRTEGKNIPLFAGFKKINKSKLLGQ